MATLLSHLVQMVKIIVCCALVDEDTRSASEHWEKWFHFMTPIRQNNWGGEEKLFHYRTKLLDLKCCLGLEFTLQAQTTFQSAPASLPANICQHT